VTAFRLSLLAVAAVIFCQFILVHTSFSGNWTALYCAGDQFNRPAEIAAGEHVFRGSTGYDGQFYLLIAHDPVFLRRYDHFIDVPRLRYRRILVPAMAFLLGAGRSDYIAWGYFVVCWCLVGLGTFCLARLAEGEGRSAIWGLLFLVTPATLSMIERMTIDFALTAITLAVLLAARLQRFLLLWFALTAAALSKETGVLVIIGVVVWLVRRHQNGLAAAVGSSVLPMVAWYACVQGRTTGDYPTSDFAFLSAYFASFGSPVDPGFIPQAMRAATGMAVIGCLWTAARSVALTFYNRFRDLPYLIAFLFAVLVLVFQNSAIWVDFNGFTRIYSPLLVCLVAATWRNGFAQTLAAFAMTTLPMTMQLAIHVAGPVWRMAFAR